MNSRTQNVVHATKCARVGLVLAIVSYIMTTWQLYGLIEKIGKIETVMCIFAISLNIACEFVIYIHIFRHDWDREIYIGHTINASEFVPMEGETYAWVETQEEIEIAQGMWRFAKIHEDVTEMQFSYDTPVSKVGRTLFMQVATVCVRTEFDAESEVIANVMQRLRAMGAADEVTVRKTGNDYNIELTAFRSRTALAVFTLMTIIPFLRAAILLWCRTRGASDRRTIIITRRIH